jgi:hypothetical protein
VTFFIDYAFCFTADHEALAAVTCMGDQQTHHLAQLFVRTHGFYSYELFRESIIARFTQIFSVDAMK